MSDPTHAESLDYPVLGIADGPNVSAWKDAYALQTGTLSGLREGRLVGTLVLDRRGREFRVTRVEPPPSSLGTRLLNLVWTQFVQGSIELKRGEASWSVEQVRDVLLEYFEVWHGWQTRDDYDEVVRRIEMADDVTDLIEFYAARSWGMTEWEGS